MNLTEIKPKIDRKIDLTIVLTIFLVHIYRIESRNNIVSQNRYKIVLTFNFENTKLSFEIRICTQTKYYVTLKCQKCHILLEIRI